MPVVNCGSPGSQLLLSCPVVAVILTYSELIPLLHLTFQFGLFLFRQNSALLSLKTDSEIWNPAVALGVLCMPGPA
jgi:hypothetical protein